MATKTKQNEAALEPAKTTFTEDDKLVLVSEFGKTTVSDDVVAKIAGLAVREVPGVHALVPFGASQTLSSITEQLGVSQRKDMGVRVEVGQVEAAVDMRIITEYGAAIPAIADAIRENVGKRIYSMTGLRVKEVNIEILDLFFEEREPPAPEHAMTRVR